VQMPTKDKLARRKGILFCSGDFRLNPDPRRYKYYWQVLTLNSKWEGDEFFENAPRLSIAAYMELMEKLKKEGQPAFVYNSKRLREGHGMPLDMSHPRWKGTVWAPSLEEDTDREYDGYK